MVSEKYPKEYVFDQKMTGENRLPARSLLLPAQKRGVTQVNFTESDRVRLLSGEWRFCYLFSDTDEPFFDPGYPDGGWDTLPVPSMWQFHGYGNCFYPNVRYCFPYDPPYIRRDNPVGLYRKTFAARAPASVRRGRAVLRFLGVDNAFFVWLNGRYIGFSKGSRIPSEFDVTDALADGENVLAVKVYTFSDASYLENQDMLMASGIFRDVMLIYTGENALWDYTLLPSEKGVGVKYSCLVGRSADAGARVRFTLCDASGEVCAAGESEAAEAGSVFLPLEDPVTWNAEEPYLYTLFIELLENGAVVETHTKKLGIAESRIDGGRLLMNGMPVTLKGVNRHEYNAKTGRAISAAQIESELRDIKAHDLNAIRCSHYTNHPLFYELCSELGIYVMDEADCETHGAECTGDQGALNKDPEWFDAFFDRVSRMYHINKNETCINIWSLGNECGCGENADRCVLWLSEQDVRKPIKDNNAPGVGCGVFDMTGYMPMSVLESSDPSKGPLLMVEYAHAMGNSPGGLEDIWNWVYEHEHCCGGYVWEFKSHGFYTEGRDGEPRYLYGGDFPGDDYNWKNFSLDGYHTSDGSPKPSWEELGQVSAPVYVRWEKGGVSVKNTYDFKSLDGVEMRWSVRADGLPVREGAFSLDGLGARQWRSFSLPIETQGLCGIVTADCVFYRDGAVIAHKQKILADMPRPDAAKEPFPHSVERNGNDVTVAGDDFTVRLEDGLLCFMETRGRAVVDAPMKINCFRAPTDNDGAIFPPNHGEDWEERLVRTLRFGCREVTVSDSPEGTEVTASGRLLPVSHFWRFDAVIKYRIGPRGATDVSVSLAPGGKGLPDILPRVGVVFRLAPDYDRCEWLGRGPAENYPDCRANAPVGLYKARVADMNFTYDVPQETGSRGDCRRVTVFGAGRSVAVEGAFSFALHDFTLEDLTAARHRDELKKSECKYLYVDHRMRGLGSHSCGPEPEEPYELPVGGFSWSFRVVPGAGDEPTDS
ncbi:MAG: DUF4981 domain-containing protein [Clostridia bacterium]|nr:DUF4981 domain-containing protein [Clostridia bacterium]